MFLACKITPLTEFDQNRRYEGVRGGWSVVKCPRCQTNLRQHRDPSAVVQVRSLRIRCSLSLCRRQTTSWSSALLLAGHQWTRRRVRDRAPSLVELRWRQEPMQIPGRRLPLAAVGRLGMLSSISILCQTLHNSRACWVGACAEQSRRLFENQNRPHQQGRHALRLGSSHWSLRGGECYTTVSPWTSVVH